MTVGKAVWHLNGADIEKVHLVAGRGKALTCNGLELWNCVDVDSADGWYEVYAPVEGENE